MNYKWKSEKRKLSELKPSHYNPRSITALNRKRLKEDLDNFGNMTPMVANRDGTIMSGHQRHSVLMEEYGGDYEVDVYIPDRKLTKEDEKMANLIHNTHRGGWDFAKLDELGLSKAIFIDRDIPFKDPKADMQTPLAYYGGKQSKAGQICSMFRGHNVYVEPFTGGGAIFWRKGLVDFNILNDTNMGVYSFWKFLKEEPTKLKKIILEKALMHEDFYREAMDIYKKAEVSIENAWSTFYLTSCGMGNSIQSYVLRTGKPKRMEAIARMFNAYTNKLQRSQVYNRDAVSLIDLHKRREDALFFLDPPYIDCEMGHYDNYTAEDFENLLKKLIEIKGDFLLTVGDTDLCDKYVKDNGWVQIKKDTRARTSTSGKFFVETIIMNYDPVDMKAVENYKNDVNEPEEVML